MNHAEALVASACRVYILVTATPPMSRTIHNLPGANQKKALAVCIGVLLVIISLVVCLFSNLVCIVILYALLLNLV